ncbi:MAG: mandelate racemase/muconate lactonizing enzyme family protein [Tannerella sp.]|jgi:L-alanine-DL-glutamate epimerase-like enolase superfamily enzyme|nr:mandelate racemase/muconate lactonizing enzyme family protein [Tannerella sp.]
MNNILNKIIEKEKNPAGQAGDVTEENSRRGFLKKAAWGGLALGGMMGASIEDTMAFTTQNVKRASSPSELKITDLRMAGRLIKIYTNQDIYGLGEVRDGGDPRYALFLKSRILGLNPCNVEMIFKIIRQFGYHARQAGGVCGVEMALWDLCGKAYGVPAWQLLGGRYRDKIRLYADTPDRGGPDAIAAAIKNRVEVQGFTWLKMDLGIHLIPNREKTIVNSNFWDGAAGQYQMNVRGSNIIDYMGYGWREHPFTQVQLTDKALEDLAAVVEKIRNIVGYEIPLSTDHYGHFDINNHIRMGRALEKFRLAWIEDGTQWYNFKDLKTLKDALETPVCTGEDIYGLRGPGLGLGFKDLIDAQCVDIIHPDLATSGGLLETKRIGDYAQENGVAMAMHMAGTPVCFMANVHCAAATENFLSLEHHNVDTPWWESMVKMTGSQPMITKGFGNVPLDSPGLGIELNEEVVKENHAKQYGGGMFEPTDEWNNKNSNDRLWS